MASLMALLGLAADDEDGCRRTILIAILVDYHGQDTAARAGPTSAGPMPLGALPISLRVAC